MDGDLASQSTELFVNRTGNWPPSKLTIALAIPTSQSPPNEPSMGQGAQRSTESETIATMEGCIHFKQSHNPPGAGAVIQEAGPLPFLLPI
jgi:hypothetical protein